MDEKNHATGNENDPAEGKPTHVSEDLSVPRSALTARAVQLASPHSQPTYFSDPMGRDAIRVDVGMHDSGSTFPFPFVAHQVGWSIAPWSQNIMSAGPACIQLPVPTHNGHVVNQDRRFVQQTRGTALCQTSSAGAAFTVPPNTFFAMPTVGGVEHLEPQSRMTLPPTAAISSNSGNGESSSKRRRLDEETRQLKIHAVDATRSPGLSGVKPFTDTAELFATRAGVLPQAYALTFDASTVGAYRGFSPKYTVDTFQLHVPSHIDWSAVMPHTMPSGFDSAVVEYIKHCQGEGDTLDHVCKLEVAQVAQKSYKGEKRILSPPPKVSLWLPKSSPNVGRPSMAINTTYGDENPDMHLKFKRIPGGFESFAFGMHIEDSEKRGYFSVCAKIKWDTEHDLKVFPSAKIKIISKPARKATAANVELQVRADLPIVLFTRTGSLRGLVRFLTFSDDGLQTSIDSWNKFIIVPMNPVQSAAAFGSQKNIQFGMVVKLKSSETGQLSSPYILQKVNEGCTLASAIDEPVLQLQKVALRSYDSQHEYLAANGNKISVENSHILDSPKAQERLTTETLPSCCVWSICSVLDAKHAFCTKYQNAKLAVDFAHFSEIPMVSHMIERHGIFEIVGSGFHKDLQAYLSTFPLVTVLRSSELLLCKKPTDAELQTILDERKSDESPLAAHILLVRTDGVIYRTDQTWTVSL